jgi:glycogen debranching enzyme
MTTTEGEPASPTTVRPSEAMDGRTPIPPADREARRQQVLTQGRASVVDSIADAVVAKHGEPFLVCRPDGQVPLRGGHGFGLYHHDCRFLAGYELRLAGRPPDALAATERSGADLLIELTNRAGDGDGGISREQLGLRWERRVDASGPTLHDELRVRNYGTDRVEAPLELRFAGGFEDVFQIRGLLDLQGGTVHDPAWSDDGLELRYEGGDGVDRSVRITVDPAPDERLDDGVRYRLAIDGRGTVAVRVTVRLDERTRDGVMPIEGRDSAPAPRDDNARRATTRTDRDRSGSRAWVGGDGWAVAVRSSSFALRAALGRSLDDLAQLRSRLGGRRYYEAGIPWFATLFGRDALTAALQTLAFDPEMAAETLRLLAARQGREHNPWRDEEPGKILHELRIGELARMGEIPHTPFYGTVDATSLFLILLGRHAAWTGSLDLFTELRDAVDGALGWLDTDADSVGDGFVDYRGGSSSGLVNQGWKDSGNAIVNADGAIAEPPIALAEVQGYTWLAWQLVAGLLDRAGDAGRADALRARARSLRDRFEARFWSDELGCYRLAIAHGKPCDVVTSNAGQVLWSGIASPDHARAVAERLMAEDMFSGWGIRTLSTEAVAYHPEGYHLGTVWPHDTSLVASGFRRYGLDDAAEQLFLAILEASQAFPSNRLPECFAGFDRDSFQVPVRYPVACHPQAWASGAIPELLTATLGLEPDGFARTLTIRRPRLPEGIETVELRGLTVGGGTADLRFTRVDGDATSVDVVDTTGELRVVTGDEPQPAGGT